MTMTTRKMSDRHEKDLVALLGGRMSKGSGNQWHNPMDGRQSVRHAHYAFAWDGKSTFGKSVGVSQEMFAKAREQASPAWPLLPLRWYANERLEVSLDLVVLRLDHFAALLADANRYQAAREQGCLTGDHDWDPADLTAASVCLVCDVTLFATS